MKPLVITDVPRPDLEVVEHLRDAGSATVHEALGQTGLMHSRLRPSLPGTCIAGTAVTVLTQPGDNLMIHVAVEQCRDGDILVVVPLSESRDGYIGELLATALAHRGVQGVVIEGGYRDAGTLAGMRFPVWSLGAWGRGTRKERLGAVNVPVVCGGVLVAPGDAVVADDDGVAVVPRTELSAVLPRVLDRVGRERQTRERLGKGEISLDIYNLRPKLAALGLEYRRHG